MLYQIFLERAGFLGWGYWVPRNFTTSGVHPTQITHWNHQLQKEVPDIFSARRAKREHDHEAFQAQLYQQIGQLKVELDWLKKKAGLAT